MIARSLVAGVLAALVLSTASAQSPATAPAASETFIHAGRVLADPATGRVETERTIVVAGGKIVRIEAGYVAPASGVRA